MATNKTMLHVLEWIEENETFRIVALSLETAQEGFQMEHRGSQATISGKMALAGTLTDICSLLKMDPDATRARFSGPGSRTEYLLWSPRGVL